MTLAQCGTVPSVLQSPVEAPTWLSSRPLKHRVKDERKETGDPGERKNRKR